MKRTTANHPSNYPRQSKKPSNRDTARSDFRSLLAVLVWVLSFAGFAHSQAAFDCTIQTEIPVVECEALVDLYESTNGDHWQLKDGWLVTNTPCDWYGVSCVSGHVDRLVLFAVEMAGPIPESIDDLSHLDHLDLSLNNLGGFGLTGPIPESIGNLSHLSILNLASNELTGSIPESIGKLSNLWELNLYDNELTGPIPESIGNLSNLFSVYLDQNELTSIPESIGNLSGLEWLFISSNNLTGPIPESLSRLSELDDLILSDNELTGPIPEWLGRLPNLVIFYASANRLTGPIPPTLGNIAKRRGQIVLEENSLEGTVPLPVAKFAYCSLTENDPSLCMPDIPEYRALAKDGKICGLLLDPTCEPIIHAEVKVFLEGPYSNGGMQARPAFTDHCPSAQPYSGPAFDGTPLECDHPDVVLLPPDSVMDWVLVSLRADVSHDSEVPGSERAAFLLTNGSIVDTSGTILAFPGVPPGAYRLVVRHRNHASVMSADTLDLSDGFGSWDFTTAMTRAYTEGGAPMKLLRDGRFGMFACDATVDGEIAGPDFDLWNAKTTAGATGYEQADCNLDGQVTAPDFNLWNANTTAGAASKVPD